MRNHYWLIFCATLACLVAQNLYAHHGFAQYFDPADQVRIEGVVHAIELRNPHTHIEIEALAADGSTIIWSCETQAKTLMDHKGISENDFVIGDKIVVTGARARREENACEVGTVYFSDGDSITFRSDEGRANIAVNSAETTPAKIRDSVFGLWVRNSFAGGSTQPGFLDVINEAGQAASAQYNSFIHDPTLHCLPGTAVRAWSAPGNPSEIRQEGDRIIIQHEFMDASRVIYMDPETTPTGVARSGLGFSTGKFEGTELVVETTNFSDGVLLTHVGSGSGGVVHSEGLKLIEHYKVDASSGNLRFEWEATDSNYFTGPMRGGVSLSATSLELGKYDCEIAI